MSRTIIGLAAHCKEVAKMVCAYKCVYTYKNTVESYDSHKLKFPDKKKAMSSLQHPKHSHLS